MKYVVKFKCGCYFKSSEEQSSLVIKGETEFYEKYSRFKTVSFYYISNEAFQNKKQIKSVQLTLIG